MSVLPAHFSTGGGSRWVSESAFVDLDNTFILIEDSAPWLAQYAHELATFPNGKHDDQADSTSQALDWMKSFLFEPPIVQFYRKEAEKRKAEQQRTDPDQPPRLTREWYYRTHGMR